MGKRNVFMVSLNSKRLERYLESGHSQFKDDMGLDVFVYDIFEVLNGLYFSSENIEETNALMDAVIKKVTEQFVLTDTENKKLVRFSEFQKELSPYLTAVYTEYFNNPSFKRNCKSQIFQNLQPRLRDVNITNHKSSLIEILAPFLLAEIAYYLYIFHMNEIATVFGLEEEMEIIASIKNGKYEKFNVFVVSPVPHIKVEF